VNAAVIVDPSVKQVIASACDESCCWNTPTNKTSIRPYSLKQPEACISHSDSNKVVTHDSLLPNGSTTKLEQLCTGVSCLYPWQWSEKQPHTPNSCYWHPLRHAALVAIESSAARDRQLFSGLGDIEDKSSELDHMQSSFTSSPAKRQKINLNNVSFISPWTGEHCIGQFWDPLNKADAYENIYRVRLVLVAALYTIIHIHVGFKKICSLLNHFLNKRKYFQLH
jgi:hypothetical protein